MLDRIEGEQEFDGGGPDKARVWWVRTETEPIVRFGAVDGFRGKEVIADFPVGKAREPRDELDRVIGEAVASTG